MQGKIKKIYEKIANKESELITKLDFLNESWNVPYEVYSELHDLACWVMIWDVLDIVLDNELASSIWPRTCKEAILWYWEKLRLPIEEQSNECIDYIYNLIK